MQAALNTPHWRRRASIALGLAALALASLWLASRIPRTLTVFVIAAFIAFGVNPIVLSLSRRMPRPAAIALVYAGLLTTIGVLILLVVPALLSQIQILAGNTPSYIGSLQEMIDSFQAMVRTRLGHGVAPSGSGDLRALLADKLSTGWSAALASFSSILVNAVTAAVIGVSALVLSAFFLTQGRQVADSVYDLLPVGRRPRARALGSELANVFGAYVAGQALLCTIVGALVFAFLALAGFKYALLLGILSGLAYAVPFVGLLFIHAVAVVLAVPQGGAMIVWVNIIVFVVARVADNLLVPKIMSESVGVSPILVMFAVFAGGELFGLPGLLLGIPVAALVKVAWRFFRAGSVPPSPPTPAPVPSIPEPTLREA